MKFKIIEITSSEVVFESLKTKEIVRFENKYIDLLMVQLGQEIEISNKTIPFEISQCRRDEIRAHHQEEALLGNI